MRSPLMGPPQKPLGWTVVLDKKAFHKSYSEQMAGRMKMRLAFSSTRKVLLGLSCLEKGEGSRKAVSQNKHKTKIDIETSCVKEQDTPPHPRIFEFANGKPHQLYLFSPDSVRDNDLSFGLKYSVHH